MHNLFIPILLGSARQGRLSEPIARYVHTEAERYGFNTELIDVRDFVTENITKQRPAGIGKWSEIMKRADGLIIVSPEYNHGYPGELKLLLDQIYQEYHHKPLGICGVSDGRLGGARMVEQLRLVSIELHMVPIRNAVYFMNARELLGDENAVTDPSYKNRLKALFDELAWYAKALKPARSIPPTL